MNTESQIIAVKQLRKDIDCDIQRVKELNRSCETALVITKLQEAVMWLGMELKRIGEQTGLTTNPYPDSKNPSNTIINPTADGLKL